MGDDQRISCEQCDELLPDVIDGKAACRQALALKDQLVWRDRCRVCSAAYEKTTDLCRRALDVVALPDAMGDRLVTFLRKTVGPPKKG